MLYKDAGVDIQAADEFVQDIKEISKHTVRPEVISGIGQFAALFELPLHKYKQPILVAATDGVGTKLKLAVKLQNYSGIGIDLVAMCANDVAVMGAEPLFFLDYYATAKFNPSQAKTIIASIATGCEIANIALIGGETAEMPGLYQPQEFDLAGFCVGCMEKNNIIDLKAITDGDVLIGINSTGIHANGFSLINHLINLGKLDLAAKIHGESVADILLQPTKIYVDILAGLFKDRLIVASAHITGGGLIENVPRVLPDFTGANIDLQTWSMPDIFKIIQQAGNIASTEMYKVFNCGVGLVVITKNNLVKDVLALASTLGYNAWVLGAVTSQAEQKPTVCFIC